MTADQNLAATIEEEFEVQPTPEDEAVWESVYGFTPQEIGVMARYVGVPKDTVTRLVEMARFIRTLPKPAATRTAPAAEPLDVLVRDLADLSVADSPESRDPGWDDAVRTLIRRARLAIEVKDG